MELQTVLEKRRSIRRYQKQELSLDVLKELVEAAILAPSWKNSQTARYYIVTSDDMLSQVKQNALPAFNAENVKDASALIVSCFVKNRSGYDKDGTPSNELGNLWGAYDLGLHNENLLLKASDMGLSTLVMGIRDAQTLRELLSIPEDQIIVSVIAVGYGDIQPEKPKRKNVEDIAVFY